MDFRRSVFCPCLLLLILSCWLGWSFAAKAETPTISDRPLMCKPSPDALCAVILSSGQSVVGRLVAVQPGENLRIQTLQGTERTVPWQEFVRAIPVNAGAELSTQSATAAAVQTKESPHEDVKITAGHAEPPSMTCEVNSSEQCRVLLRDGTEFIGGLVRLVRGERLLIRSPDNALREVQWESLLSAKPIQNTGRMDASLSAKPIQNTARMDASCDANTPSVCMVMLRDGTVIVGQLVRIAQGDRVLIKSADGMLREVPWASLLSMSSVRQTATQPAVDVPKRTIDQHDRPVSPRAEAAVVSVANLKPDMSIRRRLRRGDSGDNGSTHWVEVCEYPCARFPMYWNSKYRVEQQDGTKSAEFSVERGTLRAELSVRRGNRKLLSPGVPLLITGSLALAAVLNPYTFAWFNDQSGTLPTGKIGFGIASVGGLVFFVTGLPLTIKGRTGISLQVTDRDPQDED